MFLLTSLFRSDSDACVMKLKDPFDNYPITPAYFQDFLDSLEPFSSVFIVYYMAGSPDYPNDVRQVLKIDSLREVDQENEIIVNKTLSSISEYGSTYRDWDNEIFYLFDELPASFVQPIYSILQEQEDYYFNAAEYDGEASIYIDSGLELSHKNMIELTIFFPDLTFHSDLEAYYINKGWDPGENPPEELMPLINYLETVIIPELRNHPLIPEQ